MSVKRYDRPPVGSLVVQQRSTIDCSSLRLYSTSNINAYGTSASQAWTYGDAYTKLSESYVKSARPDGLHSTSVRQSDQALPPNSLVQIVPSPSEPQRRSNATSGNSPSEQSTSAPDNAVTSEQSGDNEIGLARSEVSSLLGGVQDKNAKIDRWINDTVPAAFAEASSLLKDSADVHFCPGDKFVHHLGRRAAQEDSLRFSLRVGEAIESLEAIRSKEKQLGRWIEPAAMVERSEEMKKLIAKLRAVPSMFSEWAKLVERLQQKSEHLDYLRSVDAPSWGDQRTVLNAEMRNALSWAEGLAELEELEHIDLDQRKGSAEAVNRLKDLHWRLYDSVTGQ